MDPKDSLQLRLAFLGLTDEDRRYLVEFAPVLEKNADNFVAAFYRHLLSFEPTRSLLADSDVKARLLSKQRAYLVSLGNARFDAAYAEDRLRIGRIHEQIGLEPRWYLGAYALYSRLLIPLILETYKAKPMVGERTLLALNKVLNLDSQLAMDAYVEARSRQLEYLNRELASASHELAEDFEDQQAALRETAERARAAEELASVATIVAGLAHEIGTPMSVIQGHAELLESSVTHKRGKWRLQTIREQIERISDIIQTLLNMARPHEPERVEVNLSEIIERSLAFLSDRFRRMQVEWSWEPGVSAIVLGDGEKLQQLFLNLFLNATDAMQEGGTLRVSTRSVDRTHVLVSVSDTGHGIPNELKERVFDAFFTTKSAGKGSGLGLMVVREIVRSHGGTIELESEVDRGTEFRISLPCLATQPEDSSSSGT